MGKKKYRILNTELSIAAHRVGSEYPRLKHDVVAKSRLMEQILLYDRVHLVTKNFLVIPLLVEWAGIENLVRLLRNDRIGFTRPTGFVGYDGKYKSIEYYIFTPKLEGDFNKDWLKLVDTADIKSSVWTILKKTLGDQRESALAELESLIVANAKEVRYPKIAERIHNETEADFLDNEIRKRLLIKAKDIKSACDIGYNQIKIGFDEGFFDPENSREIEKAFAIGLTNFDFMIAKAIGDVDMHTDNISQLILEAKLRRCLKPKLMHNGFQSLLHHRKIPDFRTLVERNLFNFNNIFELIGSTEHIRFVHWLHNLRLDSAEDILCDYMDRLENVYSRDNLTTRTIRFLVTTGLGAIIPLAGIVAGAGSFILEELSKGWHPKLFLDKIRSTVQG